MQHVRLLTLSLLSLFLVVTLFLLNVAPAHAIAFTVDDSGDASDANPGNGTCATAVAVCTLRAALEEANALTGSHIIDFSGVSLIQPVLALPINAVTLTINGAGVTVDSTGTTRVFSLTNASVIINGLTVTGGGGGGSGGGFNISGGSLTLQNGAQITGNTGQNGGGVYAISNAQITVTGSTTAITGNTCTLNGCGVNLQGSSDLFLQNGAAISSNTGGNSGGGVATFTASTITVDNATISSNIAQTAGGILTSSSSGAVTLQNGALIRGNQATTGFGGGVFLSLGTSTLSVSDTRFESNTASNLGGAIYYEPNTPASIVRSCFTDNGDLAITNANVNIINAPGGGNIANANWWGTSWGPRISGVTGSRYSNGDSISGNGTSGSSNRVDVGWATGGDEAQVPPTGAWLTSPPTINGVQCMVCDDASSIGHARTCG